ncbi:MAG: hypothetical protein QXV37_01795 [Candidatus Jordarchaeaceae archaeon]
MAKRSRWYESIWKLIGVLAVIFGLIASALQIFGVVDFWDALIIPLYDFLTSSVPVYILVVSLILVVIILRFKGSRENILDFEDARRIALLCQTPRTTEYLRQQYEYWNRGVVIMGGYRFHDYMKNLKDKAI